MRAKKIGNLQVGRKSGIFCIGFECGHLRFGNLESFENLELRELILAEFVIYIPVCIYLQ